MTLHPPERPSHTHTPKPGFGRRGHEVCTEVMGFQKYFFFFRNADAFSNLAGQFIARPERCELLNCILINEVLVTGSKSPQVYSVNAMFVHYWSILYL